MNTFKHPWFDRGILLSLPSRSCASQSIGKNIVLVRDFTDPIDVPKFVRQADIMLAAAGLILESIVKLSAAPH